MPEPIQVDNDVISHLLFHKALIDDQREESTRINEYIALVQQTTDGEHLTIDDPFNRSIAIAFELVINNHFNPWSIDLISFSSLYLKRAKQEKINLMTAGRIIYMAWKVLRLQSDDLVINMEKDKQNEVMPEGFDWGDLPTGTWMESDDGYSYTNLVMKMPNPPLDEPLRRKAERKVTLMELLNAFDEARKESEEFQILDEMRRKERDRLNELARSHMKGTAHEDHLEEDVAEIWQKICKCTQKTMTLSDICHSKDHDERIKTFISILFLAYENKIKVWQQRFPYGKIFIESIGYT
jgi:segregation and condensation protein A